MHRYRIVVVGALVASMLPAMPALAAQGKGRSASGPHTSEIVVKYRDPSRGHAVRAEVNARLVDRVPQEALEVIDPAGSVEDAISELEADPNVLYAEPNYLYEASAVTPNDPRYSSMWALEKIGMPAAWSVTTGSAEVTVAVVDSGIAMRHPDLAPNIWANPGEISNGKESNGIDDDGNGYVDDWRGWDWVEKDNRPGDEHGHGSHVAGTIAARGNDSFGVAGINWDVSLVPLRGLDHTGIGNSADIASAFHYAGELGVDVVNASFGGTGQSLAILEAITAYPDTLFIVAAGNESNNNDVAPQYPCSYRIANLMCIAATDQSDNLADFSNYGAVSVDLAAPGVGILSSAPALSTAFTDTFESDIASRWVTGGTNNLWGRGIDAEGGYLADSPALDYLPGTDAWAATAQPFSLAAQEDCKLSYELRLSTEGGKDALIVEASRDAQSWSKVEGWSGSSDGTWRQMTDPLQAFDGAKEVFLRFRLRSDGAVNDAGADIDNVRVHCQSQNYSGQEFRSASGTSMAAPHVAGVAALLKAVDPQASTSQIVSALLTGAETVPGLTGKVASSGRLSAVGALEALTAQSIDEGPGPVPTAAPTNEPAPEPVPSSEPSPEPSPEPVPTSEPAPSPVAAAEHERTITLRLVRSLQATGRVRVISEHGPCAANVPVVIKRNGTKIATTRTDTFGFYKVRLRGRRGHYVAFARRVETSEVPAAACLATRSRTVRN